MPGYVLTTDATVLCAHGGQASALLPSVRVKAAGGPVTLQPTPYSVTGCPLPPPIVANGPCVLANWVTGAVRVLVEQQPLLLLDSQAICVPTGTPLQVALTQLRVKAV